MVKNHAACAGCTLVDGDYVFHQISSCHRLCFFLSLKLYINEIVNIKELAIKLDICYDRFGYQIPKSFIQ